VSLSDILQTLREAEAQLRRADMAAEQAAQLLRGRLRHVPRWILVDLKRELRAFDAGKKEWKETA
jgi:hypothetical protein